MEFTFNRLLELEKKSESLLNKMNQLSESFDNLEERWKKLHSSSIQSSSHSFHPSGKTTNQTFQNKKNESVQIPPYKFKEGGKVFLIKFRSTRTQFRIPELESLASLFGDETFDYDKVLFFLFLQSNFIKTTTPKRQNWKKLKKNLVILKLLLFWMSNS